MLFRSFGQTNDVTVDIVTSEGERGVLANLMRKASAAERLFENLVRLMGQAQTVKIEKNHNQQTNIPTWLSSTN